MDPVYSRGIATAVTPRISALDIFPSDDEMDIDAPSEYEVETSNLHFANYELMQSKDSAECQHQKPITHDFNDDEVLSQNPTPTNEPPSMLRPSSRRCDMERPLSRAMQKRKSLLTDSKNSRAPPQSAHSMWAMRRSELAPPCPSLASVPATEACVHSRGTVICQDCSDTKRSVTRFPPLCTKITSRYPLLELEESALPDARMSISSSNNGCSSGASKSGDSNATYPVPLHIAAQRSVRKRDTEKCRVAPPCSADVDEARTSVLLYRKHESFSHEETSDCDDQHDMELSPVLRRLQSPTIMIDVPKTNKPQRERTLPPMPPEYLSRSQSQLKTMQVPLPSRWNANDRQKSDPLEHCSLAPSRKPASLEQMQCQYPSTTKIQKDRHETVCSSLPCGFNQLKSSWQTQWWQRRVASAARIKKDVSPREMACC
jgi:hypothetical protein